MSAVADIDLFPMRGVNTPHMVKWCVVIPIGASGATGTLLQGPPGIAVAKNGTGIYDVTGMPISLAATTGKSRVYFGIYSPGSPPTVGGAVVTTRDFNAGTLTFKCLVGVTVTEPASGDYITLFFEGEAE